jgi:sugar-specific transcriptional regulator TrmB
MENVLAYKNQDAHDEIRSIIDELTKLGLSTYEAKIYTTLITFGPKPASELGFFSGVPRPKVYSTIRTLEKKGLVMTMPTKPVRFSASSPERNLFPAIEKKRNEVTKCEEALQTLSIKYEARKYINSREDYDVKSIWPIYGRDAAIKQFSELTAETEKTIRIITTQNGIIRLYKGQTDIIEAASLRGVTIKLLAPIGSKEKRLLDELGEMLLAKPLKNNPSYFLAIFDSKNVLLVKIYPDDLNSNLGDDKGFWLENPSMAELEDILFEEIWSHTK